MVVSGVITNVYLTYGDLITGGTFS